MIRGVSFQIPQRKLDTLWQILQCVDIAQYDWYNIDCQNEVWSDSLQAYFPGDQFCDLHTYQEFVGSDCQILLLIHDCEFVEIYVKELVIS